MYTEQLLNDNIRNKPFYSVKLIFENHWKDYLRINNVRDIEKQEVEKMLSCKDESRGCFVCYCKHCNEYRIISFGCNSRLCSCCGKRHADNWSEKLARRLFSDVVHRHFVFSIPEMLWQYIKKNRKLQKILMDVANKTIQKLFSEIVKQDIEVGVVGVLHPFGKDLMYKPHSHNIVTEGGFNKKGEFISVGKYINYRNLHKKWQYNILNSLRDYIPKSIIDLAFRKYPRGFCAYVKPERIFSRKQLIKYLGRYVRHPSIANSRIDLYNGEVVRFFYENHERRRIKKVMFTYDFISAIIQHVPEKNEKLVRHYGIYARRSIKVSRKKIKQLSIEIYISGLSKRKRVFKCPVCKNNMEIVFYIDKPPPQDMNLIINW